MKIRVSLDEKKIIRNRIKILRDKINSQLEEDDISWATQLELELIKKDIKRMNTNISASKLNWECFSAS